MKLKSLRSRLILASILWTAGMLLLMHMASILLLHAFPSLRGFRSHGPAVFALAVMAAGFWFARGSLEPFRKLREKVIAVRKGEAHRVDGSYPSEVQPLIESLNELIEDRERAIERAHAAAGDLAHGLKTPLALLAREAATARARGHDAIAEAIEEQIRRMSNQVDRQLARARAAASGPALTAGCELSPCVEALIRTLDKIHAARSLSFRGEVPAGFRVRVRREDLDEILGNVLDNACKWARSSVSIAASASGPNAEITVEDDGPGLAAELRAAVLERGVRADEAAPGSGLGLAIVRDLTQHYGGSVSLERGERGGLLVRLTLPLAVM